MRISPNFQFKATKMIRKSTVLRILQTIRSENITRTRIYRMVGHNTRACEVSKLLVEPFPNGLLGLAVEVRVRTVTGSALKWFATPAAMTFNHETDLAPQTPSRYEPSEGREDRLRRARRERNRLKFQKKLERGRIAEPGEYTAYVPNAWDMSDREFSSLPVAQRIAVIRTRAGLNR
jgi:hypothetical protein